MASKVGGWFCYTGAVHIHTTDSDGTKTLEEVVAIGRQVKLDFMMFCDHMSLRNRKSGLEGYYGDTLVVVGYEHNDLDDNNHLLVFGSPDVYPHGDSPREYVAKAHRDGALSIVAHPIEKRSRSGKYPPYPWLAWEADQFDGMELWNQMSEWMEKLTPLNKLLMIFSPRKLMVSPHVEAMELWDRLSRKRKYLGVAGVDAHAHPVKLGPLKLEIFPYKVHFRSLRTHVLLKEPLSKSFETARDQLYDALKDCRVFFSNVRWGDADGFEFVAVRGSEEVVCGGQLDDYHAITIRVRIPSMAQIRLVRDGVTVVTSNTQNLEYSVDNPGLYRVEVWKGKRGWIFSNHIRIGL